LAAFERRKLGSTPVFFATTLVVFSGTGCTGLASPNYMRTGFSPHNSSRL
jgi:hypothetical protein